MIYFFRYVDNSLVFKALQNSSKQSTLVKMLLELWMHFEIFLWNRGLSQWRIHWCLRRWGIGKQNQWSEFTKVIFFWWGRFSLLLLGSLWLGHLTSISELELASIFKDLDTIPWHFQVYCSQQSPSAHKQVDFSEWGREHLAWMR